METYEGQVELWGERPKEPLRYLCEYGGEV
jgi:hypothetical protein